MNQIERRLFALLLSAAALLYLYDLDATGLWAPDEPRFAAVAEELRRMDHGTESLVVLRLSDQPYTQKPPLYYWLVASLSAFDGRVTETTARLPSAIAGVVCIWLTVWFGTAIARRPSVGLWSGAVLLTVFRFSHLARRAQLDVMLTVFVLLALFLLFRMREASRPSGRDLVLLHGSLALGVLTKGPVALLVVPAFAIFLAWQGRLGVFKRFFPLRSFALSLGPALAWVALAVAATPAGYFEAAIIDNLVGRFFSGTAHVRPIYYFVLQFPLEFLPWTLVWPAAAKLAWANLARADDDSAREGTRWLVCFVGLCFVFFSFSAGKRGQYLLPCYPAVAILCGMAIDSAARRGRTASRGIAIGLGIAAVLLAGFGIWAWTVGGASSERWPGFELPADFGLGLAVAVGTSTAAALVLASRDSAVRLWVLCWTVLFAAQLLVFQVALPAFDAEKSPAPIARAAATVSQKGAPIGVFDHTAMKGGIAFYSGHPVVDVRSEQSMRAFLASGGETLVVKASKIDRVPLASAFEVGASFRSGARRVVVLSLAADRDPAARMLRTLDPQPVRTRPAR